MIKIETFVVGPSETNCYLVYSDTEKNGFLIDPGFFDKKISRFIEDHQIRIKNIINTHGHIDHTAANGKFNYPVLIHQKDSEILKDPAKNLLFFLNMNASAFSVSEYLKDGDIIAEGEIKFEVIHTPGHTPGGISLKMGNIVFTGDTLFSEGVGRTDFEYASQEDLMESIKKRLMRLPDDTEVLPGHGPSTTIGHERKNNPFYV